MSSKMISVFGSSFDEAETNRVNDVILSQWVGMGAITEKFERIFSERVHARHAVTMVNSGSNALQMAMHLLRLPPASEVILPSFTWISCAHAIVLAGLKPVFCDVEADSYNVSMETIAPHITDRTSAIMVVHYAGKAVDMDPILASGLPIVEDAAHAVDSLYKGQYCGTMGDIGIYSFDSIKNIAIGEAGGIVCRDRSIAEASKLLRYSGIRKSGFSKAQENSTGRWWEYDVTEVFPKMLPTDISAAIGISQLEKLDKNQRRRKQIWEYYQSEFKNIDTVIIPIEPADDETHSYFTYLLQVKEKRDELAHYLLDKGIYTTLRYQPLHLCDMYKGDCVLPVSEKLNKTGLNIPLHPRLTDSDIDRVAEEIRKFVKTI